MMDQCLITHSPAPLPASFLILFSVHAKYEGSIVADTNIHLTVMSCHVYLFCRCYTCGFDITPPSTPDDPLFMGMCCNVLPNVHITHCIVFFSGCYLFIHSGVHSLVVFYLAYRTYKYRRMCKMYIKDMSLCNQKYTIKKILLESVGIDWNIKLMDLMIKGLL